MRPRAPHRTTPRTQRPARRQRALQHHRPGRRRLRRHRRRPRHFHRNVSRSALLQRSDRFLRPRPPRTRIQLTRRTHHAVRNTPRTHHIARLAPYTHTHTRTLTHTPSITTQRSPSTYAPRRASPSAHSATAHAIAGAGRRRLAHRQTASQAPRTNGGGSTSNPIFAQARKRPRTTKLGIPLPKFVGKTTAEAAALPHPRRCRPRSGTRHPLRDRVRTHHRRYSWCPTVHLAVWSSTAALTISSSGTWQSRGRSRADSLREPS